MLADLDIGDADAGGGFLDALALDTLALLEARWRDIALPLAGHVSPSPTWVTVAPEELSALPGIQEVLGLHEVGELAALGRLGPRRRRLRVDRRCDAHADAARPPSALYLERAWPRHRRLSALADDGPSAAVVDLLERIAAGIERLSHPADRRLARSARTWC